MDPTNSASMKRFVLCEEGSCTDLPVLDTDQFPEDGPSSGSDTEDSETEDSGLFMIGPPRAKEKEKILNMKMVNEGIRVMSYAVRGPLLLRANELEKELKAVNKIVLRLYTLMMKCLILGSREAIFHSDQG